MCPVARDQRQYPTYRIEHDRACLEVVPDRGGIITRWQVGDRDLLYLDQERFANPDLSIRGGIPILFPICGNLPNSVYTHNGVEYSLKQHGFARDLPWSVIEPDPSQNHLTLHLESNDRTRAVYPFEFQLAFTYTLLDTRLELHQQITNHSRQPMPYAIGFHPYFAVADKAQLEFDIPGTEFLDQQTQTVHPFSGRFDFAQDEIDVAFRNVSRLQSTVVDRAARTRLTLKFSDAFSTLVFWTIKGKDYYCLEPWSAPRNALNTGEHLIVLEPGASQDTQFALEVETV